jgi:hypothetical protein
VSRIEKTLLATVLLAAPFALSSAPASDFSGMWPFFLAAIIGGFLIFTGFVFGLSHFLPWPKVRRGVRAVAFGLFFAPVQYISDGSPGTFDGGNGLLGPSLMFGEPFNGMGRIVLSAALTTMVFWAIFWAFAAAKQRVQ